ncbi:aminotransferase class I/II-fold pyridoxal phosphate-dependent enzyme [Gemmatimonadota bacterium]
MTTNSLSSRGKRAADTPLRVDHGLFQEAAENLYHPIDNPRGALPLNVAENRLSWLELKAKIEEITATHEIPAWVPGYTSHRGSPEFREAAASFLAEHLTGCPVDPEHLGVSAGATSVIEMTSFILADSGDVAVIPAPSYPVYRQDLGNLSGIERYDLVTHHEPSEIADGPVLTIDDLEGARRDIAEANKRFRMLILTTPDNPTGGIYSEGQLLATADWCIEQGVHMVVNEIYGLSLIDTTHPAISQDYPHELTFSSFANLMAEKESNLLHLWYAVSKDLGISGFRVGFVYSQNAALLQAYTNLNLTHSVSNHTQWILQLLLTDSAFLTPYLARNRERLTESYAIVVSFLRRLGIPYVPSRGSHFVWIDLSDLMADDTESAEMDLWRELYYATGVLLTPGAGFGHTKRGLFRVVFPCVSKAELAVALDRLADFVGAKRKGSGQPT